MKRKILWISMMMPYDKVGHAGGKSFNYYINRFAEDDDNEVSLIAKVLPEEEKFVFTLNPKIKFYPVATPKNKIKCILSYIKSFSSKFNPSYPYGNVLTKEIFDQMERQLKKMKEESYYPNVIILEWTWMMLWIDVVKKYFPKAKYIATEHDVSFLGYRRKADIEKNIIRKKYKQLQFENVMKREIIAANKCDCVLTLNEKDKKLLVNEGIDNTKVQVIAPYFVKPQKVERNPNKKDILFYGAMGRPENAISAIWFVKNVLPLLQDFDVRFIILGSNPTKEIQELQSDRVVVTGFVDDVTPYFEKSMCMAAPLQLGAGIKIKILEALSMGIPVFTNDIGIEGIDAVDGRDYIHCITPEEYSESIIKLINGDIDIKKLSVNAIKLINDNFDFKQSFDKYSKRVYDYAKNDIKE